ENDLDVVEVGKDKLFAAFESVKGKLRPKIQKTFLRMSVDSPIPFHLAELDRCAHQPRPKPKVAIFCANREAFQFCEIREISDAQAPDRLVPDVAQKMGRREIIAV